MTRARDHLHLLVPQRFYVHQQASFGDRHVYGALTRFIPPPVVRQFEIVTPTAGKGEAEPASTVGQAARIDVSAQALALWR
jgi:DNA helicase-2/ATP-dependent DNA helicase PcrA